MAQIERRNNSYAPAGGAQLDWYLQVKEDAHAFLHLLVLRWNRIGLQYDTPLAPLMKSDPVSGRIPEPG